MGAATHAEGLVDAKRSKGNGKEPTPPAEPMPPAETVAEVRPDIICVRDYAATIQKGKTGQDINQQGIFRKQVKSNGKLSETTYEGFFMVLDGKLGKLTWTTVSGKTNSSEHKWADMKKWTILYNYLDDEEDHPPVWWSRNTYPVKEGGARNQAILEIEAAA